MKAIQLDATAWQSDDDFYSALLPQLEAPDWHGRNLDALDDSLSGGINEVRPPFRVLIGGTNNVGSELKSFLSHVEAVFADARRQGGDIALEIV